MMYPSQYLYFYIVAIVSSTHFYVSQGRGFLNFPSPYTKMKFSQELSRRLASRVFPSSPLRRAFSAIASSNPPPSSSVSVKTAQVSPVPQAPNYPTTWSTNQQPRPAARSGARFEQTAMELQPNPLSAMDLIANEPVRIVHARKAVCDGGGCFSTEASAQVFNCP